MSANLSLFAVALVVALALGSVLGAVAVSLLRARVLACDPVTRHRALSLLAALPLAIGATLALSASLPALLSLLVPALDHCDLHDDHHAHLCFVHAPHTISPVVSLLLVALAAIGAWRIIRGARRLHRARQLLRALVASCEPTDVPGVSMVESPLPICVAAGLLRPRILIARRLLHDWDPEQREIVLAHERAHVRRRDALVAALARVACAFHLPGIGKWLVDELAVAAEQACDEAAAQAVGDRDEVAAAIVTVQRAWLHGGAVPVLGPGFAIDALERRVRSLLADPLPPRSLALPRFCLLALSLAALAGASTLHHVAESAISHVAL